MLLQHERTPFPVLVYKSETKQFEVHVEKGVVTGVQGFLDGLATVLSAYWVFNLEFPKANNKTLIFIAGHLLNMEKVKLPKAVSRILADS